METDTVLVHSDTVLESPPILSNTSIDTAINTPNTSIDERIAILRKAGKSFRVIANELNVGLGIVQRSIQRTVKKQAKELGMSISREEISSTIFSHTPKAVKKLASIISHGKDDVALKASADILDRAGFAPIQRTQNLHVIEEMSPSEMRDMLRSHLIEQGLIKPLDVTSIESSTNSNSPT